MLDCHKYEYQGLCQDIQPQTFETPCSDWRILIIADDNHLADELSKRLIGFNCKGIDKVNTCDEIMQIVGVESNLLVLISESLIKDTKCMDMVNDISEGGCRFPLLIILETDDNIYLYPKPHTCLRLYNLKDDTSLYEAIESVIAVYVLKKLTHEAYAKDNITGLLNRERFIELIDAWIKKDSVKSKGGTPPLGQSAALTNAALIHIDIDGFRFINNTAGHLAADNFLRYLTLSIKNIIDTWDELIGIDIIIGRIGEDEISIFMSGNIENIAVKLAERIRKRVETVQHLSLPFHSTVSIGISFYPEHASESKELIIKANAALLHAKESGKNNCHVFCESHEYLKMLSVNIYAKENILQALAQDRFEPWFQPQLELKTNTIAHYEALARMRDIDGSIILPYAFIKSAESSSLIGYIDRVIIEKTMLRQADIAAHNRFVSLSVNLSAKNIGDAQLLEFLKYKILETKADPKRLIFEITETEAIQDVSSAINFINQLRSLGCQFALDDFGVGFTSFVYLRKMNVDLIKIDGSFIRNIDKNKGDRLIVKAMVDMAKGMAIKTVAEFVENEESLIILRDLGIDFAQGYLIGKPSPVLVSRCL